MLRATRPTGRRDIECRRTGGSRNLAHLQSLRLGHLRQCVAQLGAMAVGEDDDVTCILAAENAGFRKFHIAITVGMTPSTYRAEIIHLLAHCEHIAHHPLWKSAANVGGHSHCSERSRGRAAISEALPTGWPVAVTTAQRLLDRAPANVRRTEYCDC